MSRTFLLLLINTTLVVFIDNLEDVFERKGLIETADSQFNTPLNSIKNTSEGNDTKTHGIGPCLLYASNGCTFVRFRRESTTNLNV